MIKVSAFDELARRSLRRRRSLADAHPRNKCKQLVMVHSSVAALTTRPLNPNLRRSHNVGGSEWHAHQR